MLGALSRRLAAAGLSRAAGSGLRGDGAPSVAPPRAVRQAPSPRAGRAGEGAALPGGVRHVPILPEIMHQGRTNACGPYALAMAASCFPDLAGRTGRTGALSPVETARRLRPFRVPGVGATMPWGIVLAGRALGLDVCGHWLGRLADLKRCVDAGHPAIVVVHPDDFPGCRWHALHYRVVLGYRDDPSLPGGGELYFACSGAWNDSLEDGRPGNVALSYDQFRRQWTTYLTINWYAEVAAWPRGAGRPGDVAWR